VQLKGGSARSEDRNARNLRGETVALDFTSLQRGSGVLTTLDLKGQRGSTRFVHMDRRTHVGGIVVPSLVDGDSRVRLNSGPHAVGVKEPVLDGGGRGLNGLGQAVQGSGFEGSRSSLGAQGGDGDGGDDGGGSHCEDES
jgi:hypothetical protein